MVDLVALPPEEAIEYFRQKGFAIGFDHRDVWQAQHQASFTVAKVMQLDILQDIHAEIDRALVAGTTMREFQQRLMPTLQDKGWWGRKVMRDPLTGEDKDVQLGSPRRLKTIYDTNLRTAHSEGQWQRIQDSKEAFPYLEYDGNNSSQPRHTHSAWDGLTLPVDDPFWQAHFPVKEYGCKCRAIPRTARQVERSGKPVGPTPEVPKLPYVNARTGEVQQIPAGVHPSFHYPPGGRRASLADHLVAKVQVAPPAMARASIADLVNGPAFADWYRAPAGNFPLAYLGKAVAERLGSKTHVLALPEATLAKQLRDQPKITLDDYPRVQVAIDQGREFIAADGALIYLLEEDGVVTLVKATKAGSALVLISLRRLSKSAASRDKEIRQLLKSAR